MFFPIDIILNENPVPIRDRLPGLAKELGGTMPEELPSVESVKKLEAKARKSLRNRSGAEMDGI